MAETVTIDVSVDDANTLKKLLKNANKAADGTDRLGRSAQKADRALRGAGGMTSSTTKAFSKMSGVIQGGIVPAYAAFAANVFALTAAFDFLKRSADLRNLREGQIDYANSTGIALGAVTQRIRAAGDSMLNFGSASRAASMGLAKGFSPQQMEQIAEGARKVSTAMGIGFEEAFDRLVRGIAKAEPELLDELGITLRLETANLKYAASINKTAKSLNTAERSQAVFAETLGQINSQFGKVEPLSNVFVQLSTALQDIAESLVEKILPSVEALAVGLKSSTEAATGFLAVLGVLILSSFTGFTAAIGSMGAVVASGFGGAIVGAGKIVDSSINKRILPGIDKVSKRFQEMEADIKNSVNRAQTTADKLLKQGSPSKIVQKISAGKTLTGLDKANLKKAIDAAEKQFKDLGKVTKGIFKGMGKDLVDEFSDSLKTIERKSLTTGQKIQKRLAKAGSTAFSQIAAKARLASSQVSRFGDNLSKVGGIFAKSFFWVGAITTLINAFSDLTGRPNEVVKSIISMAVGIVKTLEFIVDAAIRTINVIISKVSGGGISDAISYRAEGKFSGRVEDMLIVAAEVITGKTEEQRALHQEILAQKQKELEIQEALNKSMDGTRNSLIAMQNVGKSSKNTVNSLSTLGLSDYLSTAADSPEEQARFRAQTDGITQKLVQLGFVDAFDAISSLVRTNVTGMTDIYGRPKLFSNLLYTVEEASEGAQRLRATMQALKTDSNALTTALVGADTATANSLISNILGLQDEARGQVDALNKIEGFTISVEELLKEIEKLGDAFSTTSGRDLKMFLKDMNTVKRLQDLELETASKLRMERKNDKYFSTLARKEREKDLKVLEAESALRTNIFEIRALKDKLDIKDGLTGSERSKAVDNLRSLELQTAELEQQVLLTKDLRDTSLELKLGIQNALESGLKNGLTGLIKGTETELGEIFKTISKGILDVMIDDFVEDAVLKMTGKRSVAQEIKHNMYKSADYHYEKIVQAIRDSSGALTGAVVTGAKIGGGMMSGGAPSTANNPGAQGMGILGLIGAPLAITAVAFSKAMELMGITQETYDSANAYERANIRLGARNMHSGETGIDRHFYFDNMMIELKNLFSRDNRPFFDKLISVFTFGGDYLKQAIRDIFGLGIPNKPQGFFSTIGSAIMAPFKFLYNRMTPREGEPTFEYAQGRNNASLNRLLAGGDETSYTSLFTKFLGDFKAAFTEDGGTFLGRLGFALTGLGDIFRKAIDDIGSLFQEGGLLRRAFSFFINSFRNVGGYIADLIGLKAQQGAGSGGGGGFLSGALNFINPFSEGFLGGARDGGVFANGAKIPGYRYGKMPGYGPGGIARGSQRGYPAILHGTEAVVPLPNGKSIPVHFPRGRGGAGNITVNISMGLGGSTQSGSGNTSSIGDGELQGLGQAIGNIVKKTLHNEKRAGGVLSDYG